MPNFWSALFLILVSLTMTLLSEKILISNRCISGLMPNLIKKYWTHSNLPVGPFCQWPTYGVPWIFVYCSRNHYSKACKIAQTFRVIIVLVRSWKFQELHVVSLMPPHRVSLPPKTKKQLKLKKKLKWYSLMNTYETAPNFIQLSQNLGTSKLDIGLFVNFCFLAVFTNFYRMCS